MKAFRTLLVIGVMLTTAGVAAAQAPTRQGQTVAGTWTVIFTLPAGSSICPPGGSDCPVPAFATATPDGSLIQTAAVPGISEGHGVWVRTGLRTFALVSRYFRYDSTGLLIGSSEARTAVTLAADGLSGEGDYEIQPLDLSGHPVGPPFTGSAAFTRMLP